MQFLFSKPSMPRPGQTLPGRPEPIVTPGAHVVTGAADRRRTPTGSRSPSSARLLLGRGEDVLAAPGRVDDGRRLPGRLHAQRHVPGGVLRQDRPRRGGARRVRPVEDELRAAAQGVLGEPRPDAGHAPGQRHGHAVPLRDLRPRRRPAAAAEASGHVPGAAHAAGYGRITTEIVGRRRRRSTSPRTTTSSTSTRTRAATARTTDRRASCRTVSPSRRSSTSSSPQVLQPPNDDPGSTIDPGSFAWTRQPAAAGGSVGGVAGAGAGAAGAAAGAAPPPEQPPPERSGPAPSRRSPRCICSNAARCSGVISDSSCAMKFSSTPG